MIKQKILLISILSYSMITGFVFSDPDREVNEFIRQTQQKIKANHKLDLGPLPKIEAYKAYEYKSGNKDPFRLKSFVNSIAIEESKAEITVCNSAECGDGAPLQHIPYFLENYELDQLNMVGTLKGKNGQTSVLIQTPDAGIVETKIGEYIGRNNGLIKNIYEDHIVIQEKQKVPRGWQNRMNSLELFK